jgi:hypothetical protein
VTLTEKEADCQAEHANCQNIYQALWQGMYGSGCHPVHTAHDGGKQDYRNDLGGSR